ncbi:uncharacterized protein LOC114524586 [Dendronephthya gigantea]|uniref:uncharacterized protein LOC114524586 n=1 Tax=Dendronephthya gigantea TaxID=151771 RepID=UPI00106D45B7|nr:uncharacterized protein LOC114524586 [Dendronephthya gigantea]
MIVSSGSDGLFKYPKIFILVFLLPIFVYSCENGTYFSHDVGGCLECPEKPLITCKNEHLLDILPCLENCLKGRATPDNHNPTPKQPEKQPSKTRNDDRRRRVGNFKLDHFIVLVACVVIIVLILLPCIICHFARQARGPDEERRTCAGYYLMHNELQTSMQAENMNTNGQKT